MLNMSLAAQNQIANNSTVIAKATLKLASGIVLTLTGEDIMAGSMSFSDATSSDGSFDIGSCIMGSFEVTLNNYEAKFENYDFTGAIIQPYVGIELDDGTTEWLLKGEYGVDQPASYGATIKLSCLDNMRLFERDYGIVHTKYPATLRTIVADICDVCGVWLAQASFENDETVVQKRPEGEWSCIAMLGYAIQASGNFARFDPHGRLTIHWYSIPEGESDLDGGIFDASTPFVTGDAADGGNFDNYGGGYVADGGTFDQMGYVNLYALSSSEIVTDDVVITGIQVKAADYTYEVETDPETGEYLEEVDPDGPQPGDTIEGDTVLAGLEGYVLAIDGNPLIQNDIVNDVANQIGERTIGMRFRPFNCAAISDPSIEAGDPCTIIDRLGNRFTSYITSLKYTLGEYETFRCGAQTPGRNTAAGFTAATKVIQELENNIMREKTSREKAIEQLNKILAESAGLYSTKVVLSDGSTIFYMHDKPKLEDSTIVWKMTAEAIGVSIDGGKTYLTGLTADGMAILNRIYTIGLDADYITTGALTVKKGSKTMLSADIDTGQVYIDGSGIVIGSSSLPDTIDAANAHYGYCSTASSASAKVVTCENFKLYKGATVVVEFAYKNTASNPTLNVNGTGAKPIHIYGTNMAANYYWSSYDVLTFVYDGYAWNVADAGALSKIHQTEDAIISTVANTYATKDSVAGTYATKSELKQTSDEVSIVVEKLEAAYGICSTGASTASKIVTCPKFRLYAGARIAVKFTNTNSASAPTLNVNGTGAKTIYVNGKTLDSKLTWSAGDILTFVYTGSSWDVADNGSMSQFRITADSITSQVAKCYSDVQNNLIKDWVLTSTFKQTVDSITASVKKIEGDYVKSSTFTQTVDSIETKVGVIETSFVLCFTAINVSAKTVSYSNFKLIDGAKVTVRFQNGNSASSPTLNVNNSGAKPVFTKSSQILTCSAYDVVSFIYSESHGRWYVQDCGAYSAITQLADSITISVTNGSLGNTASIVLSANGKSKTGNLNLGNVRNAFANDKTSITITSGTVTFNTGTFVVNSTNFKVTSKGVITATAGTIGGYTIGSEGDGLWSSYVWLKGNCVSLYKEANKWNDSNLIAKLGYSGLELYSLGYTSRGGQVESMLSVGNTNTHALGLYGYNDILLYSGTTRIAGYSTYTGPMASYAKYWNFYVDTDCHGHYMGNCTLYNIRIYDGTSKITRSTVSTNLANFYVGKNMTSSGPTSWRGPVTLTWTHGLLTHAYIAS